MNAQKIKLVDERGENSRLIEVEIDERGDLVLSGFDTGPLAEEFWHDWDYEYWLIVGSDYKESVLHALIEKIEDKGLQLLLEGHTVDQKLLILMKTLYQGDLMVVSLFRFHMDSLNIPTRFYSY